MRQDQWTSIRLTKDQRQYIEGRAAQRSESLGLQVVMADVVREAIDLLREHKPLRAEDLAEQVAS